MRLRGAIFDLDGTLLDSMSIWDTIGADYLRSLGYTPREDLCRILAPMSMEQAADYYRREYGVPLTTGEIIGGVNARLEHFYKDIVPLKEGADQLLARLAQESVKMCIATSSDRHLAEAALSRLGVRGYFSEIITCAKVGSSKQFPYIYEAARKHLGTAKEETVVFEDALHAIQTAKEAGFFVAAVYDSHEREQEEIRRLADLYIRRWTEFRPREVCRSERMEKRKSP